MMDEHFQVLFDKINDLCKCQIKIESFLTNELGYNTEKKGSVQDLLSEILNQTKKTNGRVGKLEAWKSGLAGAVAILSIIITLGVPILYDIHKSIVHDISCLKENKSTSTKLSEVQKQV